MPFDFETVPSGESIFPSHLYRDDGVYLCRSIHAIRAYKFEGESLHDNESVSISSIRERVAKEKLTVKQRKKLDSSYQQIGESLDMLEQVSLFDKKKQNRIEEESKRRVKHDISELKHQRGEYEGDDEMLATLDALQVRTVEVTKLVERIGEKVCTLLPIVRILSDDIIFLILLELHFLEMERDAKQQQNVSDKITWRNQSECNI